MCHRQEVAVVYTRTNFGKLLDAMKVVVVEDTAFIWTRQRVDGQRHERS